MFWNEKDHFSGNLEYKIIFSSKLMSVGAILCIASQPLNEMGAVHALVVQTFDSAIHQGKNLYSG